MKNHVTIFLQETMILDDKKYIRRSSCWPYVTEKLCAFVFSSRGADIYV